MYKLLILWYNRCNKLKRGVNMNMCPFKEKCSQREEQKCIAEDARDEGACVQYWRFFCDEQEEHQRIVKEHKARVNK